MKQKAVYPKVASDMFWSQLIWAFGFLGIMLIIHIVKLVLATFNHDSVDYFFNSSFIASNIFMFVIGIIAINFLAHFIGHGVTRKDYFKGNLIAAIGLSLAIPIISFIVNLLDEYLLKKLFSVEYRAATINEFEIGESFHIIEELVEAILLTPYVNPESNWLLALAIFSLNIFFCYIVGWLISASFYRLGTIVGLASILLASAALMIKNALLRISLELPVKSWYSGLEDISAWFALVIILIIIIAIVTGIHGLLKKVTVKM